MKSDTNILAELEQEAPTLATISRAMPYSVAPSYFNTLHKNVLAEIAADNLPKVSTPFTVPSNYFNTLSTNILTAIAKEEIPTNEVIAELDTIAPLLNTINKAQVYSVPNNYFTTLHPSINNEAVAAKVVPFPSFKRKVLYIAAACVIGVMAVSAFIFTKNTEKIDYAAYKQIDVNSTINNISNEELLNYLENVNTIINSNSLTTIDVKMPDIQDHIQSVSDEELRQYLKETVVPPSSEEYQLGI